MKKNFSNKSVSVIGCYAKKEFSVFGECVRVVRRMFEAYAIDPESLDNDLAAAIADCLTAGINPATDLNIGFIVDNLTKSESQWIVDGQIVERIKGELIPVAKWTPNKVITYVRRANRAQLDRLNIK